MAVTVRMKLDKKLLKHCKNRFQGSRLIKQNQMIPQALLMKIVILLFVQPAADG